MIKIKKIFIFFVFIILSITKSYSLPSNPNVISGTLAEQNISSNEINLQVADKTIINWDDFSINLNETVNFLQPSDLSTVLNRVTSNSQSEILGHLKANGNFLLINPNGIIIGKDATIETASFLVSSLNLSDTDFLNNNYRFVSPGVGSIINLGTIKTISGDVTILGKTIRNEGNIEANGNFNVGLGEEILLQNDSNDKMLIKIKLTNGEGFTNTQTIQAIKHEIKADGNPYSYAINLDGEIIKSPIEKEEGKFYLSATDGEIFIEKHIKQDDIFIEGKTINIAKDGLIEAKNKGTIVLNSKDQLEINGTCQAFEGNITITNESREKVCFNNGVIDVSGDQGGTIDLTIPKFINTGSLKADSKSFSGGIIKINSENMIEVQKSSISANSEQNIGGNIDIFAKNNFFTSGNHSVNGKNKGGIIKIETLSDNLNLISSQQRASGRENGQIILQSNKNVILSTTTQLLGFVQHKLQQLSVSPANFEVEDLVDPNFGSGSGFGDSIVALDSGNVVVSKPLDSLNGAGSGACYLYNGNSLALISTLLGANAGDNIASNGITKLSNDNYVIESPSWNSIRGAATFGNKTTGISGTVGASNSLVGSAAADAVSSGGIAALTNGNYVVSSPVWDNGATLNVGAATWGDGSTGSVGVVSSSNSLIGPTALDSVSSGGIYPLTNGHYVVASPLLDISGFQMAGAATWGDGTSGTVGSVDDTNSFVGQKQNDDVSSGGITALTNGNYVVSSPSVGAGIKQDTGAATWGNGANGEFKGGGFGAVSAANSLWATLIDTERISGDGIIALTNGNYVVVSSRARVGAATFAGAATWGDGTVGVSGSITTSNSIAGSANFDNVGGGGAIVLSNGNFVVESGGWNGSLNWGAATWGNGADGKLNDGSFGVVSAANSLVGSATNDLVSLGGITALTNGNYVVSSHVWDNGAITNAGAATWGDGTTGTPVGSVDATNSLVGSTAEDQVSSGGITALTNDNYVVSSPLWDNGGITNAGAATWGDGTTGTPVGTIDATNSLVGSTDEDQVSSGGITALTNGNYVVSSPIWDNGAIDVGAATWGNGNSGIVGSVSSTNSLSGTVASDQVSNGGVEALSEGNYIVLSPNWDNEAILDAGAATLADGSTGITGLISTTNSVIGNEASSGLAMAVEETVFDKIYISFTNDDSGNGRVAVVQSGPIPPPPAEISFDFVLINNTTFAARNEMFVALHPYNEYINQYLEFSIFDEIKQVMLEKQVYMKTTMLYFKATIAKFFIRIRNNTAISNMQESKSL
ncbi:MAG: Heme/hemopexin-binding protein [Candidatus Anoxychlamydiales bacterium]|nr:Heme/hemopexin-binding protein [Candidatus Anoxychlamydiales bacterium]